MTIDIRTRYGVHRSQIVGAGTSARNPEFQTLAIENANVIVVELDGDRKYERTKGIRTGYSKI